MDYEKLNDAITSLVELKNRLERITQLEEGHIEWLRTDIQLLMSLADNWEIEVFT
jgi:bacterioferritin (cytochrome b1)